ncbi:MAG TPA: hypothetical protein VFW45_14415 [Candidatus Polarisedimenticolia bacterium]|nr:hypothetical protein [Candidatus Polarisedimenticolia bacterium]
MTASWRRLLFLPLAMLLPGAPRAEAPPSPLPISPVELRVDTLRVGADGTRTLAEDQARLFVGKGALLSREITLEGRADATRRVVEKLGLKAELRVVDLGAAGLTLLLKSKVRVLALSGGGPLPRDEITRELALEIGPGASQLATVYESPVTGLKATLNIRWSIPDLSEAQENAAPVQVSCLLYEVSEAGETVLADHRLLALPGAGASATFDRIVPLPGTGETKRARQEQLEIKVIPRFLSGRTLSAGVEVGGEVSTLLPDGKLSHPVVHQGNYLFTSGLPVSIELESAAESPSREGWERVRYRLEILTVF